jgi:cysteine synthase A
MARAERSEPEVDAVESVADLVGETPLERLDSFADNLFGKLEAGNPYSVKDRIAREILDAAEREGSLGPGGTVVESTSGNTGIGLAAIAAATEYAAEHPEGLVVTVLPDGGERYLSTDLYEA